MKRKDRYNIFFIVMFLCTLFLPLLLSNKVGGGISSEENRYLAKFPKVFNEDGNIVAQGFRKGFEDWINDNAFGRELASKINRKFNLRVFRQNATKDIMFGKDGWIFLTEESNIKRIQNADVPSQEKIQEFKIKATEMTEHFKDKNIDFMMTVFPHKVDVYSEYLQDTIRQIQEESLLDVFSKLKQEEDFDVEIDVHEFMEAKKQKLVYSKAYDSSHWNNYGAFIGYSQLMEGIKKYIPGLKILSMNDFEVKPFEKEVFVAGELYTTETDYEFNLEHERTSIQDKQFFERIGFSSNDPWYSYNYYRNTNSELPKAVIIGDSYVWMFMLENLAESFSELVFIHQLDVNNLDQIVNVINPDIVVAAGLDQTVYTTVQQYELSTINNPERVITTDKQYQYLDFINNQVTAGQEVTIDTSQPVTILEGWAVDILADKVATGVVIQVGEETFQAEYGKSRDSVVSYFNKPQWENSGYHIALPTQKLIDAGGFRIYVISNDGTYKYESLEYIIEK